MLLHRLRARAQAAEADAAANPRQQDADSLAVLARLIYNEMNIDPRQMHLAIVMAQEELAHIRQRLIDGGLRRAQPHRSDA